MLPLNEMSMTDDSSNGILDRSEEEATDSTIIIWYL